MIRAKFSQTVFGTKYKKGDPMYVSNPDHFVRAGVAYRDVPVKKLVLDPESLDMSNTWRQIFNSLKNNGFDVREGMTKQELLDLCDDS